MNRATRSLGFTLIELVVSLGIVAILVALLLPAIQQTRETSRRSTCQGHLRQLAFALDAYVQVYQRCPAGIDFSGSGATPELWSWQTRILPFVDARELYLALNQSTGVADNANRNLLTSAPKVFRCPADPVPTTIAITEGPLSGDWALTNYLGVSGNDGAVFSGDGVLLAPSACARLDQAQRRGTQNGMLFGNGWVRISDVKDGITNTLVIGERGLPANGHSGWLSGPGLADACPNGWTDVVLPASDELGFGGLRIPVRDAGAEFHWWSYHPGGAHFAFVDGRAYWFSYSIDPQVFRNLSTRAGGELVEVPGSTLGEQSSEQPAAPPE